MSNPYSANICFRWTEEWMQAIKDRAKVDKMTCNDVMRLAIEEYLLSVGAYPEGVSFECETAGWAKNYDPETETQAKKIARMRCK